MYDEDVNVTGDINAVMSKWGQILLTYIKVVAILSLTRMFMRLKCMKKRLEEVEIAIQGC